MLILKCRDFSNREYGSKSDNLVGMTRLYAPPEALEFAEHGRSGDVFSLGLVMGEMVHYMNTPLALTSAECRLEEIRDGTREYSGYIPGPITSEEKDFLHDLSSAARTASLDSYISLEELNLLFAVMTAEDPLMRPSACDVWAYLKNGEHDEPALPTCGECCQ